VIWAIELILFIFLFIFLFIGGIIALNAMVPYFNYKKQIWKIRTHVLGEVAKKEYNYDLSKNQSLEAGIKRDIEVSSLSW